MADIFDDIEHASQLDVLRARLAEISAVSEQRASDCENLRSELSRTKASLETSEREREDARRVMDDEYRRRRNVANSLETAMDDLARERSRAQALAAALEPFASGAEWGTIKAWLVAGAEVSGGDRALGVKVAGQITRWQVAVDAALAAARGEGA